MSDAPLLMHRWFPTEGDWHSDWAFGPGLAVEVRQRCILSIGGKLAGRPGAIGPLVLSGNPTVVLVGRRDDDPRPGQERGTPMVRLAVLHGIPDWQSCARLADALAEVDAEAPGEQANLVLSVGESDTQSFGDHRVPLPAMAPERKCGLRFANPMVRRRVLAAVAAGVGACIAAWLGHGSSKGGRKTAESAKESAEQSSTESRDPAAVDAIPQLNRLLSFRAEVVQGDADREITELLKLKPTEQGGHATLVQEAYRCALSRLVDYRLAKAASQGHPLNAIPILERTLELLVDDLRGSAAAQLLSRQIRDRHYEAAIYTYSSLAPERMRADEAAVPGASRGEQERAELFAVLDKYSERHSGECPPLETYIATLREFYRDAVLDVRIALDSTLEISGEEYHKLLDPFAINVEAIAIGFGSGTDYPYVLNRAARVRRIQYSKTRNLQDQPIRIRLTFKGRDYYYFNRGLRPSDGWTGLQAAKHAGSAVARPDVSVPKTLPHFEFAKEQASDHRSSFAYASGLDRSATRLRITVEHARPPEPPDYLSIMADGRAAGER